MGPTLTSPTGPAARRGTGSRTGGCQPPGPRGSSRPSIGPGSTTGSTLPRGGATKTKTGTTRVGGGACFGNPADRGRLPGRVAAAGGRAWQVHPRWPPPHPAHVAVPGLRADHLFEEAVNASGAGHPPREPAPPTAESHPHGRKV